MSSLVLLNSDGCVVRKINFITLSEDFIIPEGMMVSWRTSYNLSSGDPLAGLTGPREPVESFFYFRTARGQICSQDFRDYQRSDSGKMRYASRTLIVTVQGSIPSDVMMLRDKMLQMISSGARWKATNDLNPRTKITLFQRIRNWFI